jgi:hypothetical protein
MYVHARLVTNEILQIVIKGLLQFRSTGTAKTIHTFSTQSFKPHLCGLVVRVPGYRSNVRVRFPVLSDFLTNSVSGTGSTQEPFERKSSGSGLESREYGRWDPSRWPRVTLYQQKLALTSSSSGGRSVGLRPRCSGSLLGRYASYSHTVSYKVFYSHKNLAKYFSGCSNNFRNECEPHYSILMP